MIIYWSMVLWVPIIYILYSLTHREDVLLLDYNIQNGIQKKVPLLYAFLTFGYLIFWIGMRTRVADTGAYEDSFDLIPNSFSVAWSQINWSGKRPGFDAIAVLFKSFISKDSQMWLMFVAIVSGLCVMQVLRKYSVSFFYSSFLFMTMITYTWMMNGMRQFICVAVIFAFCDWIRDGKFVQFALLVLLLSTIHITAIMMIPIYFVVRCEPWSKKIGLFIIAIILICIFAEPIFNGLDDAISGTDYAGFTDQFAQDDGVNPIRVLFYAVPPVLAFIKREKIKEYYPKNSMLKICINASLITASLYFVGMFTSGILIGRLPIYTEVYNLIFIPYLLRVSFTKDEMKIVWPIFTVVMLLFFYLNRMEYYWSPLIGKIY